MVRFIDYGGHAFSNEEKLKKKDKERIIVLSVTIFFILLSIGAPAIITIGKKLFAVTPVLY